MRPFADIKNRNGSHIRLYQEDCLEGMRHLLEPNSVSVTVTSPPYNIGIPYSKYNDHRPREDYLDWVERVGEGIERVLVEQGSFFLNLGSTPSDPLAPLEPAQRLRSTFVVQNVIHWVKSIAISENEMRRCPNITGPISVGHYKPIGGTRYLNDSHEYVFHLTKTGQVSLDRLAIGVPYQDKSNIGRWKSAKNDLHCRGNIWFIPYQTIQNRNRERPHPSTFPDRLAEMCIQLHSLSRTRLVLDPFVGIGSTALAAQRLGLSFIGFDIDETYLSEAKRRLEAQLISMGKGGNHEHEQRRGRKRRRNKNSSPLEGLVPA